jgi:hypothetical protein
MSRKIEFRAVLGLIKFCCPRCGVQQDFSIGVSPKAIFNSSDNGVLVSVTCPKCTDPVQVYAAGESYGKIVLKEKEERGK